jgi:hypothetical protein
MPPPPVYKPNNVLPILPKMGPPIYRPPLVQSKSLLGIGRPEIGQTRQNRSAVAPAYKPASSQPQTGVQPPPVFRPSNSLPVLPKMKVPPYIPAAPVQRKLTPARIAPPRIPGAASPKMLHGRSSHTVVQRDVLEIGTDTVFAGSDISETDLHNIETMCGTVGGFLDETSAGKKLLHIGVGVGNPSTTFGNQSVLGDSVKKTNMSLAQVKPAFVDPLIKKGSTVAAIVNFNPGSSDGVHRSDDGNLLVYPVNARFPLNDSGELSRAALAKLQALKLKATHFSIMNSVSQINYESIVSLGAIKKDQPSLYLKSYAETGTEEGHMVGKKVRGLWMAEK